MAVVKMHNGILHVNLHGDVEPVELGERIEEVVEHPRAQQAKGIDVDGVEYMPGVDIRDWAEDFVDYGGEG